MPRRSPTELSLQQPQSGELFTGRERELSVLARLAAIDNPDPSWPVVTTVYGVAGSGKSSLAMRLRRRLITDKRMRVAAADFDTTGWLPETPFVHVLTELTKAFAEVGVELEMTTLLLTLHTLYIDRRGQTSALREFQQIGLDFLDKGAELLEGLPGVALFAKTGKWIFDRVQRTRVENRVRELGLWPIDNDGRMDLERLEVLIASAAFEDLRALLSRDADLHVLLVVDGFDRLQSYERRLDAQMRLQELLGYFAATDDASVRGRFRALILGRERLRWDVIYNDPAWAIHLHQLSLSGLDEDDSRQYLRRRAEWMRDRRHDSCADALYAHGEQILVAAREAEAATTYSPFYLALAANLVERSVSENRPLDLGQTHSELQDRFLRHLGGDERRALMVLALAGSFDESLFDWLAGNRLVNFPLSSFHSSIRREHSYFQEDDRGTNSWRFHRLFEAALLDRWDADPALQREQRHVLQALLTWHRQKLENSDSTQWDAAQISAWSAGMELLVRHGIERGAIDVDAWKEWTTKPWSERGGECVRLAVNWCRRAATAAQRQLGEGDTGTVALLKELTGLLVATGGYREAISILRGIATRQQTLLGNEHVDTLQTLLELGLTIARQTNEDAVEILQQVHDARSRVLGPNHRATLHSAGILASAMPAARASEAEALYRRTYEAQLQTIGLDEEETQSTANNLALLLLNNGRLDEASVLLRTALERCQRIHGDGHLKTLVYLSNLSNVVREQGHLEEAETLHRRVIACYEAALGHESLYTLFALAALPPLLRQRGKVEEARAAWDRLLRTAATTLGPDHLHTLGWTLNFAEFLLREDGAATAGPVIRRTLESAELVLGVNHDVCRSGRRLRASCLAGSDDPETAARGQTLLRAAVRECEQAYGPNDARTIDACHWLALTLEGEESISLLRQVMSWYESNRGKNHANFLYAATDLARALIDAGRVDEVERLHWVHATKAELFGPDHRDTIESELVNAAVAMARGDVSHCERTAQRVLELRRVGSEHHALARLMLGMIAKQRGDLESAEQMFRGAYGDSALVPKSLMTAAGALAPVLADRGLFDEAATVARRLVDLRSKWTGRDHYLTLAAESWLGSVLIRKEALPEALELFRLLRPRQKLCLGRTHLQTINSTRTLAQLAERNGENATAKQLLTELKADIDADPAVDALTRADVFMQLGRVEHLLGDSQTAFRLMRPAVKVYARHLGAEHSDTLSNLDDVGLVLAVAGRYRAARGLLRRVLIVRDRLAPRAAATVRTAINLAIVVGRLGDLRRAHSILRIAFDTSLAAFGALNELTVQSLQHLDEVLEATAQDQERLDVASGFISAGTNQVLAMQSDGHAEQAEKLLSDLYDGSQEMLGRSHDLTRALLGHRIQCLRNRGANAEADVLESKSV